MFQQRLAVAAAVFVLWDGYNYCKYNHLTRLDFTKFGWKHARSTAIIKNDAYAINGAARHLTQDQASSTHGSTIDCRRNERRS